MAAIDHNNLDQLELAVLRDHVERIEHQNNKLRETNRALESQNVFLDGMIEALRKDVAAQLEVNERLTAPNKPGMPGSLYLVVEVYKFSRRVLGVAMRLEDCNLMVRDSMLWHGYDGDSEATVWRKRGPMLSVGIMENDKVGELSWEVQELPLANYYEEHDDVPVYTAIQLGATRV